MVVASPGLFESGVSLAALWEELLPHLAPEGAETQSR